MAKNSPNYDALLEQIQNLSDLQNNGSHHISDPAKQALYMVKLQEQAESIKRVLKLLNPNRETLQKHQSQPQLPQQQHQQQLQLVTRQLSHTQLPTRNNRASYSNSNGDNDTKHGDFNNRTGEFNYRGSTPNGDRLTPGTTGGIDRRSLQGGSSDPYNNDRRNGSVDRLIGQGDRYSEEREINGRDQFNLDFRESIGYEQLWELSTTVCEDEVPEVREHDDILDPPSTSSMMTSSAAMTISLPCNITTSADTFLDDQLELYENASVMVASDRNSLHRFRHTISPRKC